MRESKVEAYLKKKVRAAGGEVYKFTSPGRRNVPDDIIVWPHRISAMQCEPGAGHIHFVECKAPGKKPRPAQAREHNRLMLLGCVVLVLDTIEKVDNYVMRNK